MSIDVNRKTVEKLWGSLSARDWPALESCLAEDVHYEDVPTEDPGARGPENVVKRLRIAFDQLTDHDDSRHGIGDLGVATTKTQTELAREALKLFHERLNLRGIRSLRKKERREQPARRGARGHDVVGVDHDGTVADLVGGEGDGGGFQNNHIIPIR